MSDLRRKDADWQLPGTTTWEMAICAVLMDIRDELKTLNRVNFQSLPFAVQRIARNTAKPRKSKPRKTS